MAARLVVGFLLIAGFDAFGAAVHAISAPPPAAAALAYGLPTSACRPRATRPSMITPSTTTTAAERELRRTMRTDDGYTFDVRAHRTRSKPHFPGLPERGP